MKTLTLTLAALLLTACGTPCERPHIELIQDEDGNTVIEYKTEPERPIDVKFEILKRDSTTVIKCTAKYTTNYSDIPNTLLVKVCANGKCGMENGITGILTYHANEWDELLDVEKITCLISQPGYAVCTEGFLTECYETQLIPKKTLLGANAPVEGTCLLNPADPYADYCKGGYWDNETSRFVCEDGWY
jgi:hypothetical protein